MVMLYCRLKVLCTIDARTRSSKRNSGRLCQWVTLLAAFGGILCSSSVTAQPKADSFNGRKISLYVSTGPGGGYDAYARLVARFISRYLPGNPTVIVENMPGAGGRNVANYLYNVAPKDGTAI